MQQSWLLTWIIAPFGCDGRAPLSVWCMVRTLCCSISAPVILWTVTQRRTPIINLTIHCHWSSWMPFQCQVLLILPRLDIWTGSGQATRWKKTRREESSTAIAEMGHESPPIMMRPCLPLSLLFNIPGDRHEGKDLILQKLSTLLKRDLCRGASERMEGVCPFEYLLAKYWAKSVSPWWAVLLNWNKNLEELLREDRRRPRGQEADVAVVLHTRLCTHFHHPSSVFSL